MQSAPRVRHRSAAPDSCSGMWRDAHQPAWGSAAPATFWVALEQPGPWGNKAFVESRLDPRLGAAFERECAAAGGRALLIRTPSERQADGGDAPARRLYVAGGMPSRAPWLLSADIDDPKAVLDLPFRSLIAADPARALRSIPGLRRTGQSVLLVCTNSKRDTCCALLGRPVAAEANQMRPGRVWECTHTGGHRFAATGIVLPIGATLARLTTDLAVSSIDAGAQNRLSPRVNDARHHRGLAHLRPPAQAADAWVRSRIEENDTTALTVHHVGGGDGVEKDAWVTVTHRDGRTWDLMLRKRYDPTIQRRNSCTTPPVAAESWEVTGHRSTDRPTGEPATPPQM